MSKIKLLVEIDEDEYKIRKEMAKDGFDSAVTQMIVNGTPYNPTGDCISREDLKKALKSNCKPEICHDYGTNWCESCCPHNDFEDLIDDAQSIPLPNEQIAWDQGYEAGLAQGKHDRPQGERIRLDLAKRVIAKFEGYLDDDMVARIQIALEKENEADMRGGAK